MAKRYIPPDGYHYQFVAWITDRRTGKRIYASWYGKRAFPILVRNDAI